MIETNFQKAMDSLQLRTEMLQRVYYFMQQHSAGALWFNVVIKNGGKYHHEVFVRAVGGDDASHFEIARDRMFVTANPEKVETAAKILVEIVNELMPESCSKYPVIE